jgi:hypothetical protein
MFNFLLATVTPLFVLVTPAFVENAKVPDAKCLDGAWTVVCYEKGGEAQTEAKGMSVKAENGTITCTGREGKPAMTMKVVIGQNGCVQVTEMNSDAPATPARAGVYVLTNEFLAISLNTESVPEGADKATTDAANKTRCSILLKRDAK